ncbi:MAG: TonB-dependent receptor [Mediterranea sp.]|jgi:hypothetical protein|nr:TonB-dependent receptor [Mediterranea sp.]
MKFLLMLLACMLACGVHAQTTVRGIVTDKESGLPLDGVIIKVLDVEGKLITYTVTAKQGNYLLRYTPRTEAVRMLVNLLGYKTLSVQLPGRDVEQNFAMQQENVELKEVMVRPPAISKMGDTLNYRVDRFMREHDRSIADVLSKMPGITVNGNGTISYMGKPISKFYIEGMDLMGRQYGIASTSIPSDAVKNVQVLENHQPVRALQGVSRSEYAALNLVLKEDRKLRPMGYMEGGVGVIKNGMLWDADLFGLQIAARRQSLLSYKSNNVGKSLSNLLQTESVNVSDLDKGIPIRPGNLFSPTGQAGLPVNDERYRFNNSHLVNYSRIAKSGDVEWRLTGGYLNEQTKQTMYSRTEYNLPDEASFLTIEDSRLRSRTNKVALTASIENNESKFYLSNILDANADWQHVDENIMPAGVALLQKYNLPYYGVRNRLEIVRRKGGKAFSAYSYLHYVNMPQRLRIESNAEDIGLLTQQASRATFFTINGTGYSWDIRRHTLSLKLRLQAAIDDYSTQHNNSRLEGWLDYESLNRLHSNEYAAQLVPGYNYKLDRLSLSVGVPVRYLYMRPNNQRLQVVNHLNILSVEPSANMHYRFGDYWQTSLSYQHTKQTGDALDFADATVMKDYLHVTVGSGMLEQRVTDNYSWRLAYRNQIDALFFNLSLSYRPATVNTISGNRFTEQYIISYIQRQSHRRNTLMLNTSVDKFVDPWQTNLKLRGSYTQTDYSFYQQQQLYPMDVKSYELEVVADAKLAPWINVEANLRGRLSAMKTNVGDARINRQLRPMLTSYILPDAKSYLSLSIEYSKRKSSAGQEVNFLFADIKARRKMGNCEVTLTCQNIFNKNRYEDISYGNLEYNYLSMPLRSCNLIANVRWNFK